jgi:hypothetical protein
MLMPCQTTPLYASMGTGFWYGTQWDGANYDKLDAHQEDYYKYYTSSIFFRLLSVLPTLIHLSYLSFPSKMLSSIPYLAASLALASAATTPAMTMDERFLARRALNTGMGTRYGADCTEEDCWQSGACSFTDYVLPSSVDGSTCISDTVFGKGENCGGCISVTYKGKTITVMVTNQTGGDKNHLDMTPDTVGSPFPLQDQGVDADYRRSGKNSPGSRQEAAPAASTASNGTTLSALSQPPRR